MSKALLCDRCGRLLVGQTTSERSYSKNWDRRFFAYANQGKDGELSFRCEFMVHNENGDTDLCADCFHAILTWFK